jgi:vacuolar fusion protein MON1
MQVRVHVFVQTVHLVGLHSVLPMEGQLDELVGAEPGRVRAPSVAKADKSAAAAASAAAATAAAAAAVAVAVAGTGTHDTDEVVPLIIPRTEDDDDLTPTPPAATAAAAAAAGPEDSSELVVAARPAEGGAAPAVAAGTSAPRPHAEEDPSMASWAAHRKHFFVLSSAGKPIYTKYGDDSRLATLFGIIQALISFVQDDGDTIRSIRAGAHTFAFLLRGPIYLVAVARTGENETQLRDQLQYLYAHLLSVLTLAQITRIYAQRNNYDLRNLLSSTDTQMMDALVRTMDRHPAHMLGSVQFLRLAPAVRATVGQVVLEARGPDLLYAILLAQDRLVTLVRPRRHSLHPADLHLLFNMVTAVSSFRAAPESWAPVCLPKFNAKGFLYAHVSFLEGTDLCLLLLSTERDRFFALSETRTKIVRGLRDGGVWTDLLDALPRADYAVADVGVPGLRHFLYLSRSAMQFTAPRMEAPYGSREEQTRLMRCYQYLHHHAHARARPRRILYVVGQTEVRPKGAPTQRQREGSRVLQVHVRGA